MRSPRIALVCVAFGSPFRRLPGLCAGAWRRQRHQGAAPGHSSFASVSSFRQVRLSWPAARHFAPLSAAPPSPGSQPRVLLLAPTGCALASVCAGPFSPVPWRQRLSPLGSSGWAPFRSFSLELQFLGPSLSIPATGPHLLSLSFRALLPSSSSGFLSCSGSGFLFRPTMLSRRHLPLRHPCYRGLIDPSACRKIVLRLHR